MIRLGLALLTIVLFVAPLIYGFYQYGGDLSYYLKPRVEELSLTPPTIEVVGYDSRIDLEGGRFEVEVALNVTNSLPYQIKVESLSFDVLCAEHGVKLGSGQLREPVVLGVGEHELAYLDLSLTPQGVQHVVFEHTSFNIEGPNAVVTVDLNLKIDNAKLKVKVSEVEVETTLPPWEVPIYHREAVGLGG